MVWALLAGPIIGLVGVGWVRLVQRAGGAAPPRVAARYLAPLVAFMALGVVSLQYPQLLGNGKDIVQLAASAALAGAAGGPVRAQAAGHRRLPGLRLAGRPVHADARDRRAARRRPGLDLGPHLAGLAARQLRA